jgi:hypothetical protein
MMNILVVLVKDNFRDCEYLLLCTFLSSLGIKLVVCWRIFFSTGRFGFKVDNDFTFDLDFEEL